MSVIEFRGLPGTTAIQGTVLSSHCPGQSVWPSPRKPTRGCSVDKLDRAGLLYVCDLDHHGLFGSVAICVGDHHGHVIHVISVQSLPEIRSWECRFVLKEIVRVAPVSVMLNLLESAPDNVHVRVSAAIVVIVAWLRIRHYGVLPSSALCPCHQDQSRFQCNIYRRGSTQLEGSSFTSVTVDGHSHRADQLSAPKGSVA